MSRGILPNSLDAPMNHETLEDHWRYNCEDCVRTFEIAAVERQMVADMGLQLPEDMQQSMFWPVLQAMITGIRIDLSARSALALELMDEMSKREAYFNFVLDHPLNPASPKQMQALFYDDLKQRVVIKRSTGNPTLDDDALTLIGIREPLLRPLLKRIAEYRSLGVFLATFVNAPLDADQRMRCSYNICGTETYRLASRKNAFDTGTNLQNIPKGGGDVEDLQLPNIRKLFIPDPGYTFFDGDLDRADLQVVVWEAGDNDLKQMLKEGIDIHAENAKTLNCTRQEAKSWVHGTNYGGTPRTMAINCGLTVQRAEYMQDRWFEAHPGILEWHKRTKGYLLGRHYVENKYGYRRHYFDRPDAILPEALAWVPQSTVAITINKIWHKIYSEIKEAQVLLQVHDSLAGQFPTSRPGLQQEIQRVARSVVVPYDDPLNIPFQIKTSTKSWGDCHVEELQ
jgi:DNA polymerase I